VVVGQAGQRRRAGPGQPNAGGRVGGEAAAVEHAAEVGGPGQGQGQGVAAEQGGRLGDAGGEGDGGVVDLDPDPGRLGQVEGVAGQAVGHVDHGRRPGPGQPQAHGQGGHGPAVGGGQAREPAQQIPGRLVAAVQQPPVL